MTYLAAVLILLWLFVGGYLLFMLTRQRALKRELRSLERNYKERNQGK